MNYRESIRPINRLLLQILGERTHIGRIIEWVSEHPRAYARLLEEFDMVVMDLNNRSVSDVPKYCKNFHILKRAMGENTVPTIHSMLSAATPSDCTTLERTLSHVNVMMQRGETTKEEPYIRFHTSVIDAEALVAGTIFHITEEYLLNRLAGIKRGDLEGGLIEILSLQPQNPLWDAVSNLNRLNWVNEWSGFENEFRLTNGFK